MLFRKKMKLLHFLEGPYLEATLDQGAFRHDGFYDVIVEALAAHFPPGTAADSRQVQGIGVERDYFSVTFLGAFLWLLKYRTLSTNRNSPRKLAFLDLLFDMEMPRFIKKHLGAYDVDRVEESYNHMDIRCKEVYTGELPGGEPPPFLVSPIWAKDASPPPFRAAASVFLELVDVRVPGGGESSPREKLVETVASHFTRMTEPVEKASARINFTWGAPQEEKETSPSREDPPKQGL